MQSKHVYRKKLIFHLIGSGAGLLRLDGDRLLLFPLALTIKLI